MDGSNSKLMGVYTYIHTYIYSMCIYSMCIYIYIDTSALIYIYRYIY